VTPLDERCDVCKAKPGEACTNTLRPGAPLPGRSVHLARTNPSQWEEKR